LVEKSSWDNELVRFSWRIDLQTKAKTVAELDDPTAILEFAIASPNSLQSSASGEPSEHVIRFEMDKRQLAHAVHEFNKIEAIIDEYTHAQ
jgi:COMM domain